MVAHPLWGMSMIVPIVGNTDRESWDGRVYEGRIIHSYCVSEWFGYYGDWNRATYGPDFVTAPVSEEHRWGITLYNDPWRDV